MTAADAAPPIGPDRYLALLAVLLAVVLALLVIGEREKPAAPPPVVVGKLPPPPDQRLGTIVAERDGLLAEQARLAEALAATETALGRAETEATGLAQENERLRQQLGERESARDDLARRLAAAETERNRLGREVAALRQRLQGLLAEPDAARTAPPAAAIPTPSPDQPTSSSTAATPSPAAEPAAPDLPDPGLPDPGLPDPSRSPEDAARIGPLDATPSGEPAPPAAAQPAVPEAAAPDAAAADAVASASGAGAPEVLEPPHRLTTFGARAGLEGDTVEAGVEAYNAGDYVAAARIWAGLAAAGDRRAQFHFGSLLFEGRTAPPDRVMAHVWLSRSVDAGYLPAIEVRRRVRAAMSEAEHEAALAIQAGG